MPPRFLCALGVPPFESLDGKFVYYTKQTPASGIWRVPTGGGEETQVIDRGAQGGWAMTAEGIGFFSCPDSAPTIQFYRFSSAITPIAALPKGVRLFTSTNHLAISRDLRWMALQPDRPRRKRHHAGGEFPVAGRRPPSVHTVIGGRRDKACAAAHNGG